jgi:hypothetical protein
LGAAPSVLLGSFSTIPFEYRVKMAWPAPLVLVLLMTATDVTDQLVFSKRHA